MTKNTELRISPIAELRSTGPRRIAGYAARFDGQADLGGFIERIRPGAFARVLKSKPDVRCLFNHDANNILGRTSAGTLALSEDSQGLKFSCELPDTQFANDLWKSISRGDVCGCSFAFTVRSDTWPTATTREIVDIEKLYDVGPVTYPAYESTSVDARRELVAAECRSARECKSVGFYCGTREAREQSRLPVSAVDVPNLDRLSLRLRLLKMQ